MKAKIELTKAQIDQLVKIEEDQLMVKFEKDLASIRKKYEIVEINLDVQSSKRKSKKVKLTDEAFKSYLEKGIKISEVAILTGYNVGYLGKMKKRIFEEAK